MNKRALFVFAFLLCVAMLMPVFVSCGTTQPTESTQEPASTLSVTSALSEKLSAEPTADPIEPLAKNRYFVIPAFAGTISEVAEQISKDGWLYDPGTEFYSIGAPVSGTECTYRAQYSKQSDGENNSMLIGYSEKDRIVALCFVLEFQTENDAKEYFNDFVSLDKELKEEYKGKFVLLTGNLVIIHSPHYDFENANENSPHYDFENANEIYKQTFIHLCSLLGIDYDALELFEFEAPETITYSQILCAFDAGLSAETIGKALEDIIPEGMQEVDASELIKSDGMKSIRSWRDAGQIYIIEEYEDINMAKDGFNFFLGGASTVTSIVRIDSCVLTLGYANGIVIKTLLKNLGLIEDIPDSYTIPAEITIERNDRVKAYIDRLEQAGNMKKAETEDGTVLYANESGSRWVTCMNVENTSVEGVISDLRESADLSFMPGTKIRYDDHYVLIGIVYPMEEYLTDTSE
ncbi:MAG: hypothetical protein IJU52_09230 [Clostridia bacterium]|nr:hypothetical protein [Clostridia bacterium]